MPRALALRIALLASLPPTALAAADRVEEHAAPIAWRSPAPDVVAVAGGTLEIAWRARAGAAAGFEEWEAFLSLDGGAHWPYRLTPHLGAALDRFVVELPPVASEHARLLLRYGDERDERELLLPFEFAVAPPAGYAAPAPARTARHAGESARAGEPGVVAWVDGPRDGSRRERVESGAGLLFGALPSASAAGDDALALAESEPDPPAPAAPLGDSPAARLSPRPAAPVESWRAAASGARRLARLGRRNE